MNLNEFLRDVAPNRYGDLDANQIMPHSARCLAREVLADSATPKACDCYGEDEPSVDLVIEAMWEEAK